MKHIKLFEGFENGEYYGQLTLLEFLEKLGEMEKSKERITDNEIHQLDKVIKDFTLTIHRRVTFNSYHQHNPKYSLDIWKMEDDWFLVKWIDENQRNGRTYTIYYLCDQFEGLLELFKDKINL